MAPRHTYSWKEEGSRSRCSLRRRGVGGEHSRHEVRVAWRGVTTGRRSGKWGPSFGCENSARLHFGRENSARLHFGREVSTHAGPCGRVGSNPAPASQERALGRRTSCSDSSGWPLCGNHRGLQRDHTAKPHSLSHSCPHHFYRGVLLQL